MQHESALPGSDATPRPLHPESIPAELQAFAECLWRNQANLITQAAEHFGTRPSLVATILLPVLFQAVAGAHPNPRAMKRLVNETIDKGFDDWLRAAQAGGAS